MNRIALGIPNSGDMKFLTARSIWQLTAQLGANAIEFDEISFQSADLALSRNEILNTFLISQSSRLFFIDTDMVFSVDDAWKLISSTLDYVGSDYSQKTLSHKPSCTPLPNGERRGSCAEAKMVSTGLLSLSRNAVQRMADASEEYISDSGLTCKAICFNGPENGYWRREDETMCRKWQSLGGKAYIDTSINIGHIGSHEFRLEHEKPKPLMVAT